jgi:AcrR family transcriptional regulator
MRPAGVTFTKDSLLDAAEAVVVRDGIGRLTLDAVAAEAGASKGGLLHHFRSKESLIEALVHRTVEQWRQDTLEALAAVEPGPGRLPRAILAMCLGRPEDWNDSMRRSGFVLVAALANNPELVEPLRRVHLDLFKHLNDDSLPPGVGEAVLLAAHGLWFEWIFGLREIGPGSLMSIRSALELLVRTAAHTPPPSADPTPSRKDHA